jgi:archaellum component FlaF (FlaF/FlaG flagellin family)
MFNQYAFQAVESIQSAKKQFVSTFVQHEQFAKVLNNFVDAQTEYTKAAITAGSQALNDTQSILTDRTPYVNFTKKIAEYFPTAACATGKKAK